MLSGISRLIKKAAKVLHSLIRNHQKLFIIIGLLTILMVCINCQKKGGEDKFPNEINIQLKNPIDLQRLDSPVKLQIAQIKEKDPNFNPSSFIILHKGSELAHQLIDANNDAKNDIIFITPPLEPGSQIAIQIRYTDKAIEQPKYTPETQALVAHKVDYEYKEGRYRGGHFKEFKYVWVPDRHRDHDAYFRFEGPGWESEEIAYRLYLDQRNTIDIFGKKTKELVLQKIGVHDLTGQDDSYHSMQEWGMDILKVGPSLGIGTIAGWLNNDVHKVSQTDSVTCEIVENGPLQSAVKLNYYGWQLGANSYNLESRLSIASGSRLTHHEVAFEDEYPSRLCTGLVKHPAASSVKGKNLNGAKWNYFATWGKQDIEGRRLGMVIFYRNDDLVKITEDDNSHILIFRNDQSNLDYYFGAAWELEPEGIKTKAQFKKYLKATVKKLSTPVEVNY
jgi:hypothetical protein